METSKFLNVKNFILKKIMSAKQGKQIGKEKREIFHPPPPQPPNNAPV